MDEEFLVKKSDKRREFRRLLLKRLKRVRLTSLLLLALLMVSSSFAWFIYATRVSNNINAYVKSWKVNFLLDTTMEEEITFVADAVYPGMETLTQEIKCVNSSDVRAILSYEIVEAKILGDTYKVTETYTSSQLESYLQTAFPFSLTVDVPTDPIEAQVGEGNVNVTLDWPYESGDDEKDTEWGYKAYTYHKNNPTEPSIKLTIKIIATQADGSGTGSTS